MPQLQLWPSFGRIWLVSQPSFALSRLQRRVRSFISKSLANVRSFSLFTFFAPPATSALLTLLPASCPGTWEPIASDFADSAMADFVS